MAQLTDSDRDAIIDSLLAGRKLEAIKRYRDVTGNGLSISKEFIDRLEARLREESPERFQTGSPPGCGAGVVLIVMLTAILAGAAGAVLLLR